MRISTDVRVNCVARLLELSGGGGSKPKKKTKIKSIFKCFFDQSNKMGDVREILYEKLEQLRGLSYFFGFVDLYRSKPVERLFNYR